jgi:RNA polymerase sigma factor (sigma-70 family)
MSDPSPPQPTPDERRHAACLAMGKAPGLIRFAARYTRSLHDAEDAYQRTMEIALSRAPVTDTPRFMAWLHTVLRHEALAVARKRRRESPGMETDIAETVADRVEDGVAIDAVAEWRERYRSIQDGLAGLTEAQRTCLILQSSGASYDRIGEITGYSRRKVERSVLEGRASLRSWEVRLASGEVCDRMGAAIDRVAQGEATARERRSVTRHVRHCGACRVLLRDRRESNEWLANLVPLALVGGEALLRTPDPTPALAWWDRIATGATVRAGTVVQMALDMPSSALAKVGAGTAAVAVAGAAGAPLVIDTIAPPAAPQPSVAALQAPTSTHAGVVALPKASPTRSKAAVATFAAARRRAADALATKRARERRQASVSLPDHPDPVPTSATPPPRVPRVAVSAPAVTPEPAAASAPASSASEVAIEFGP